MLVRTYCPTRSILGIDGKNGRLAGATLELLAEEEELNLVVDGQHTSASDATQDIGTGALEKGANTFSGNDLAEGIEGGLVLDGLVEMISLVNHTEIDFSVTHLTRRHHHATTDSVKRVGSDTSTSRNTPAEQEGGKEVVLERTNEDDRLKGVVHTEVQTTVNDDTSDRGTETTVEADNAVRSQSLPVDINQTGKLTFTTLLRALCIVGQAGTGVIEGVDKEEGCRTGSLDHLSGSNSNRE